MRRFVTALVLTLAMLAPLPVAAQAQRSSGRQATATSTAAAPGRRAAEQITAAQLKDYLTFVASDLMEGRDTPSRGLDLTAQFIAMNLSRWGIRPAGDNGTYFQKIALRRTRVNSAQTSAEIAGQSYKYGEDFLAQLSIPGIGGSLMGMGAGPLVYVGNGWVIRAKNMDAYQGVDVKGKIMIVAGSGFPRGVTFNDVRTGTRGQEWSDPMTYAVAHGAKGIIYIPGFQSLAFWDRTRKNAEERGSLVVEKFQNPANAAGSVPAIVASLSMLNALMRGESRSAADLYEKSVAGEPGTAFDLDSKKQATLNVAVQSDIINTQNVMGIWEGADPVLRNEYVAIGAHYDHVGVGTPVGGDAIYNGADDDGSGTVSVLAMAEAFAHSPRPKRSILFVWHCGEEKGLWGSRYFTENPTVPLNQIVTQLNIDMIGRSRAEGNTNPKNAELSTTNEIYVIGSKMMSTELGLLSDSVNQSYLNINYNFKYDDPADPNQFFFRSDHYNYARRGVPIIFYFDGEHEDYHRPGDEVAKIDFQKMERVSRTIFLTGWEIANLSARPKIDKQLPAELNR
jgi:Zn-dependent M28 family amino/carboxypeptidase